MTIKPYRPELCIKIKGFNSSLEIDTGSLDAEIWIRRNAEEFGKLSTFIMPEGSFTLYLSPAFTGYEAKNVRNYLLETYKNRPEHPTVPARIRDFVFKCFYSIVR